MRRLLMRAQAKQSQAVVTALIAVVYFGLARLSLLLAFQGTNASPVWPPSGFALTVLLAFGPSKWLAIAIGALTANAVTFVTNGAPLDARVLGASLLIAIGNASEAVAAEFLLRRQSQRTDSALFKALTFACATGFASALAATVGSATVVLFGFAPRELENSIFLTWCIGDWVGILLLTPLILSFLPLDGGVLRLGRVLPSVVAMAATAAIWLVAETSAPTGSGELNRSLLRLQAAVGTVCVLGLLLDALGSRSKLAERRERAERAREFWASTARGALGTDETRAMVAPLLAGLGVLGTSLLLWRSVLHDQRAAVAAATQAAADNVVASLESSFSVHARSLLRLAARWNRKGGLPEDEWRDSARAFIADFQGFEVLEWVDRDGNVRFHEPSSGDSELVGFELLPPQEGLGLLAKARTERTSLAATRTLSDARSEPLLLLAVALEAEQKDDGAVLSVVRLRRLFDEATRRVTPDFSVRLSDTTGLQLGALGAHDPLKSVFASVAVPGRGTKISVEVRVSARKARTLRSALPEVILGGGSVVSAMVAILLFLAQEVSRRERKARSDRARLLRMNEELAEERKRAEAAARAKSEFLANMSHELRTPMSAVVGLSALLRDSELDPTQREYVNDLELSSNLLRQLIDDILDLSKLDAGKVTLEHTSFAVRPHLEKLLQLVARAASEKGLSLELEVDPSLPTWFIGDPLRLGQILLNLLSNAVKFTERGRVLVRASGEIEGPDGRAKVHYEISDTGPGIDPSTRSRLFAPFSQADASTTRRFGGTGLGLYISRSLVQLMGGELQCLSEVGRGATFFFTVRGELGTPIAQSSRVLRAAKPITQRSPDARARILVAEDNAFNRKIAVRLLEHLGYDVEVAVDGAAAVEAVRQQDFDLVLMDWQMPEMDGLQATAAIREEQGDELPIVALTANAMEGDRERCLAAGMNDYLTKPLSLEALRSMLARWLPARPGPSP